MILWNRFIITYGHFLLSINYCVIVESKRLTHFKIGQNRSDRLELMKSLSDDGYSNKEISEILNKNKIYKVRTKGEYSHNDVCMGLIKYRRRLERIKSDTIIEFSEDLILTPIKISKN